MDIQKEAFESNFKKTEIYRRECAIRGKDILEFSKTMGGYFNIVANDAWNMWQAAKAQAVPEGFVLVPKLLSDELADELASDAFNNIQSMFDYEHRGSTATHREQIRLRWCKNKAREFQENYKIVIEAQEQKG